MESIYQKLVDIEEKGIPAALCTMIESSGSTPRKAGTKMIVFADGTIFETIGGGALEKMVIDAALKSISDGNSQHLHIQLDSEAGMACGGNARVFIEPLAFKKRLYIFGAGHIGSFLAFLAHELDFAVTVIDERQGIFESVKQPAITCINEHPFEAIEKLIFDAHTYICVTTHNHMHDKEIVARLGNRDWGYLGMIGSKAKVAQFSKELLETGQVTAGKLSKINWPMGVPINCQTPREIAVSVLAKLVDVRSPRKKFT